MKESSVVSKPVPTTTSASRTRDFNQGSLVAAAGVIAIFGGYVLGAVLLAAEQVVAASISALIGLGLFSLTRYRSRSFFSGSLTLVYASIALFYAYGLFPRPFPMFEVEPTPNTLLPIVLGSTTLLVTLLIAGNAGHSRSTFSETAQTPKFANDTRPFVPRPPQSGSVVVICVLASLGISILNFVTGEIPLLSGDVNNSRFNGNFGALGKLWPLTLPVLQVAILITLILTFLKRATVGWILLGSICLAVLVLNGGRSLFLIPIIAFGMFVVESARPRMTSIIALCLCGIAALGAFGLARRTNTDLSYLSERNLDSWTGSIDMSLQTGPRVFEVAQSMLEGNHLFGQILFGDILNFFQSSIQRSDRVVTLLIGRDPVDVGGMPPTLWGGLFLDFGMLGVLIGAVILGVALVKFRSFAIKSRSWEGILWYTYFATYTLISVYSYLSVRPSWIVVLGLCVLIHFQQKTSSIEER